MKDFQLRKDTKLLFRNDPVADLTAWVAGKKVLFVYGGGSVKTNGCHDDVKTAVEKGNAVLLELDGASRELADIERGIAMAKYHEADIRTFLKDAFGLDDSLEAMEHGLVRLFTELGVGMHFSGEATIEQIRDIDINTSLTREEVLEVIKNCLN